MESLLLLSSAMYYSESYLYLIPMLRRESCITTVSNVIVGKQELKLGLMTMQVMNQIRTVKISRL